MGETMTSFVDDPDVPAEVAKRLLAGLRARVTMDLVQMARQRRRWSPEDIRLAIEDWAASIEYALGLYASYPGMSVPSLPRSQVFNLEGELEKHARRRMRLSEEALRAADELKK